MKRITDYFVCVEDCPYCVGTGYVCEDHPLQAWGGIIGEPGSHPDACWCGAAGMPCQPKLRVP